MFATVASASLQGIEAEAVQVEVNAGEAGEPRLILVGLPDASVKESDDRVFSALSNTGFRPPRTRTTINLAPGHLRKEGPIYDLPIALGILVATGQLPPERIDGYLIVGELSLSGAARPVRGAFAMAVLARRLGLRGLLLPPESAEEAMAAGMVPVHRIESLGQAFRLLAGLEKSPSPSRTEIAAAGAAHGTGRAPNSIGSGPLRRGPINSRPGLGHPGAGSDDACDFTDLRGQPALRRAIEVAVAGAHNLLISGPPGSGKSMAARCIPSILPPLTREEFLEILAIRSAAGTPSAGPSPAGCERPFRSPHHRSTDAALLGGGAVPRPGEITLAHHGVLFLDELPEFRRSVLEVLRQPLEDGRILLCRSAARLTFPCSFMLVAAMNPCPCGHLGDPKRRCRCTATQIERYRGKISGPLLDRIDIHVEASAVSIADMRSTAPAESSAAIRARVEAARARQAERFLGRAAKGGAAAEGAGDFPLRNEKSGEHDPQRAFTPVSMNSVRSESLASAARAAVNARMSAAQIRKYCALTPQLGDLLQHAMERLNLSARAYDRILKVSRTVADLAGSESIDEGHLLEAIQYRSLDRMVRE